MSEHRLSEIVIERPRRGMRISLRKRKGFRKQLNQLTEDATQDGLLSPYLIKPWNKSKYLTDHLGPLRRFLRSHVGHPWDDVYSLLCQQLDTSTMTGQHVIGHVWDYVERHVELIDGIPYRKLDSFLYSGDRRRLDEHYRDQFYVHPETGILCVSKQKPRKQKPTEPPRDWVGLDAYNQYHQLDGIWYLITFWEFPGSSSETVRDVLKGLISRRDAEWMNGQHVYAARKRQCNKKEIRFILNQISKL
jgi:hypothetical protein